MKNIPGDHVPPSHTFGAAHSPVSHNYRLKFPITNKDINSLVCGRDIDQHNISCRKSLKSLKSQNDSGHINAWILKRTMSKGFKM